ncbi:MAG: accessory gene regulator ArgB-like protein [Eubacterium sp.]
MRSLFSKIVNILINDNVIQSEDRELYEYSLYVLFLTIYPLFVAVIIATVMGVLIEGMIIISVFAIIRRYSGGHHAKTVFLCFLESTTTMFLFFFAFKENVIGAYLYMVLIIATIQLCIFSPIENVKHLLNEKEKIKYKKHVLIIIMIMLGLILLFRLLSEDKIASCIALGICMAAFVQIPCLSKRV